MFVLPLINMLMRRKKVLILNQNLGLKRVKHKILLNESNNIYLQFLLKCYNVFNIYSIPNHAINSVLCRKGHGDKEITYTLLSSMIFIDVNTM